MTSGMVGSAQHSTDGAASAPEPHSSSSDSKSDEGIFSLAETAPPKPRKSKLTQLVEVFRSCRLSKEPQVVIDIERLAWVGQKVDASARSTMHGIAHPRSPE
ncbi:hypothetical protein Efla_007846 [Eimeria flavescens]